MRNIVIRKRLWKGSLVALGFLLLFSLSPPQAAAQAFPEQAGEPAAPLPHPSVQQTNLPPRVTQHVVAQSQPELAAWQVLTTGINSPSGDKRVEAVNALATIENNPRAVQMLERALKDKNSTVRQHAAAKLGEMNATDAIPALKDTLEDQSEAVKFAAAQSLAQLGDLSGRRILIDVLTGKRKPEPGFLGSEVAVAKKEMKSPGSILLMGGSAGVGMIFPGSGWGLRMLGGLMKDRTSSAKVLAANALGSDPGGDAEIVARLEAALKEGHPPIRLAAAQALGSLGAPQAIPNLQAALRDSHSAVSYMAAASIVRLNAASGAPQTNTTETLRSAGTAASE